ncbi:hypothetical protein ACH4E7_41770 [Kitasatospora sp. NPDC018058]|uniref:hypothetical protein n=1 Tax=Kitasatospora sp. NPDC018058 TaxID=3364025 RepID=UPI0037C17A41
MYDEGGLEFHEGTPEDVRVIVAAMTAEVKDGPRYDAVPWERFHHAYGPGDDVPDDNLAGGRLDRRRAGSSPARPIRIVQPRLRLKPERGP